jgi:prepilin-type processing-associated H-X9-DG protein
VAEVALGDVTDPVLTPLTADAASTTATLTQPDDVAARHTAKAILAFVDGHVAMNALPQYVEALCIPTIDLMTELPSATADAAAGLMPNSLPTTITDAGGATAWLRGGVNNGAADPALDNGAGTNQNKVRLRHSTVNGNPAPSLSFYFEHDATMWLRRTLPTMTTPKWWSVSFDFYLQRGTGEFRHRNYMKLFDSAACSTRIAEVQRYGWDNSVYGSINGTNFVQASPNTYGSGNVASHPDLYPNVDAALSNTWVTVKIVGYNGKLYARCSPGMSTGRSYTKLDAAANWATPTVLHFENNTGGYDNDKPWWIDNIKFGWK